MNRHLRLTHAAERHVVAHGRTVSLFDVARFVPGPFVARERPLVENSNTDVPAERGALRRAALARHVDPLWRSASRTVCVSSAEGGVHVFVRDVHLTTSGPSGAPIRTP